MFKLESVKPYKELHGHRFTYSVQDNVLLRRDDGLLVFAPKGATIEVSIVRLHLLFGGFEAAVIFDGDFIAIHRADSITAEEVLSKILA